ncbi:MAG TPA: MBL fold metallo-hydrolase, partial [Bdellovibrionota bacterium]|nr:MBL fold metallo-hydrolase [Bdellovibrionota bacterium]
DSDQNQSLPPPEQGVTTISPESLFAPELSAELAHLAPPPVAPPPPGAEGQDMAPPPPARAKRGAKAKDAEIAHDEDAEGVPSGRDRAVCPNGPALANQLVIHHIYVGQGDATYIRTPGNGVSILIDGGESGNQHEILEILKECYKTTEVDYLLLSHPHSDHFGGLTQLLKLAQETPPKFKINKGVYMTAFDETDLRKRPRDPGLGSKTEAFMKLAMDLNAKVRQRNLKIPFGTKAFESRNPREQVVFDMLVRDGKPANRDEAPSIRRRDGFFKELNPTSSGIHIRFGTFDYFTAGDLSGEGDAEPDVEGPLVDSGLLKKMDVYKASHHGSDTSNSSKLLDVIDPTLVVVSAGDSGQNANAFHLPRIEPILDMHARVSKKPGGMILQMSCGAGNVMPVHPFCTRLLPINMEQEKKKSGPGRKQFNYLASEDGTIPGGMRQDLKKFVNTQGDVLIITDGSQFQATVPHHPIQPRARIVADPSVSRFGFRMEPEQAVNIGPFRTDGR